MLIEFKCNNIECNNKIVKLFRKFKDVPPMLDCGACGVGKMERQLGAPSSKSTQIIDNGAMARQVELMNEVVLKEEERLYREDD